MKHYDDINNTLVERPAFTRAEIARRTIRSIQRRLGNPTMPADVRAQALNELRHHRLVLMRGER